MTNFFVDKDRLNIPWTISPFFYKLLENSNLDEESYNLCKQFYEEGYIVLDLNLEDSFVDLLKEKVLKNLENIKTQEDGYHYSDSPRLFEAWKTIPEVAKLASNKKILEILSLLYNRTPYPFQTINFIKGSNQPLHSDFIHFGSIPFGWVAASWVALEDVDENNGTLAFCPKSHFEPFVDFVSLNLDVPKYGEQFEKYSIYEEYIKNLANEKYETRIFTAKKGQCLIWAANLLHGGIPIIDKNRTRWSQATHYYFDNCRKYYSPMFSDPYNNLYAEKDLKNKNILGKANE